MSLIVYRQTESKGAAADRLACNHDVAAFVFELLPFMILLRSR
jgi:hypothetical protein